MSKIFRKLITSPRGKDLLIWLIWHLPTFVAVSLAARLEKLPYHVEEERHCLMCQAHKRIERASHKETIGPRANVYCTKCGLDKPKWKRFCPNKVLQVNYRPPKTTTQRYHPMFWE